MIAPAGFPLCATNGAPHLWWPRPDLGPDAVRCTECATTSTEAKLSPEERAALFGINVVRLFHSTGRKLSDLKSFAHGQWQVFASQRERERLFERSFLRAVDAAATVMFPGEVGHA